MKCLRWKIKSSWSKVKVGLDFALKFEKNCHLRAFEIIKPRATAIFVKARIPGR